MSRRTRKLVAALMVVMLCYGATIGTLMAVDKTRTDDGMDEVLYLPNQKLLSHFTAGLNTVIANLLWLNCIQYTAQEYRGRRNFTWLEQMIITATQLDPHFVAVYRLGAMFLAALPGDANASIRIAEEGFKKNPLAWQLPYEAAMTYLMNKKHEPDARYFAAQYLNMSAATGRAIGGVYAVAAKLQDEFSLTEIEQDMWRDMLDNPDKFIRELAQRKLIEIDLRAVCKILNEQIELYTQHTGRNAQSLEELFQQGYISQMPEDPLEGYFFLGEDGKAYNTTLLADLIRNARADLITYVLTYNELYSAWPESLDELVEVGLLEKIPAHPWPGKQWTYHPETGEIDQDW